MFLIDRKTPLCVQLKNRYMLKTKNIYFIIYSYTKPTKPGNPPDDKVHLMFLILSYFTMQW